MLVYMQDTLRSALPLALVVLGCLGCSGSDDPSDLGGEPIGGTGSGSSTGSGGRGSIVLGGASSGGRNTGGQGGGTAACEPNLTGLVRDFRAQGEEGGHPDFEAFSGQRASKGIVRAELGADRKPVYNGTGPIRSDDGQQTTSKERFDEWYRNTQGVNQAVELTLELRPGTNGVSTYESREFFPIDGKGFGNYEPFQNGAHNFHFTFELHTTFSYNGNEVFRFIGDDDLWVFINGKLAIDLGGLHSELDAEVSLDRIATEFGLVKGRSYPLDLFHAERHTSHSRFRIDTSIEFTNCDPIIIPR